MKRIVILACMAALLAAAATAQIKEGQTAYVTAKSLPVKSGTGFFARTLGTLKYGDPVTVVRINGKWAEIRSAVQINGWAAHANLSTKRVTASGGSAASSKEVAMAGKGFNEEVENAYKESHTLNYGAVDAVESNNVGDDELLAFISEGRLSMGDE
ncbi:MAG: SH3 domain-containing protein [Treponema sp.]|nr:SH3 domain-containing protein [Treponema sp.]